MSHEHLDTTLFGEPAPHEPRRGRRQRQKRSRGRSVLVLIVALVLVGAATATAFTLLRPVVGSVFGGGDTEAGDFTGPGDGNVPLWALFNGLETDEHFYIVERDDHNFPGPPRPAGDRSAESRLTPP